MSDYIRRQDAVNVAESYEVKRDGFHLNDYEYGRTQVASSIASDLEDVEPADVAPVVRCRDCKHLYKDGECPLRTWYTHVEDDFCSYGKKR